MSLLLLQKYFLSKATEQRLRVQKNDCLVDLTLVARERERMRELII